MGGILLLGDDAKTRKLLSNLLKTEGYQVDESPKIDDCWASLENDTYHVLFVHLGCTFDVAHDFVTTVRNRFPDMPVLMSVSREEAEGLQSDPGRVTYVPKPFTFDTLMPTVQEVFEFAEISAERVDAIQVQLSVFRQCGGLIVESPAMQQIADMIERVAQTDVSVFLHGEHGTDKAQVARAFHLCSKRESMPFVCCHCREASTAKLYNQLFANSGHGDQGTVFQQAEGGTVFLDAIEALNPELQRRLAEVIATREVKGVAFDVRMILGGHAPPLALADRGLEQELAQSLSAICIEVKPLRQRREDILPLFIQSLRKRFKDPTHVPGLDARAARALKDYGWPGNVSELVSVVESVVEKLNGSPKATVTPEMLPKEISESGP